MEVKLYTTPTCTYCYMAKQYLNEKGIPFTEHDVWVDRAAAEEMIGKTGQMAVPVIIVNGQTVVGFNRPLLEDLLAN